jgi:phosphate/sulfate permease
MRGWGRKRADRRACTPREREHQTQRKRASDTWIRRLVSTTSIYVAIAGGSIDKARVIQLAMWLQEGLGFRV